MATVYHGVDQLLRREVAVKVLHRHLAADATFLDRFLREARAAAGLAHPNVVAVYDQGQDDDAYLVMELVDGPSLRDVLRARGRLPAADVVRILAPAATGVGAVHDRDLVHRDVKPENILIGEGGQVKVTDFGLARAVAASTHTFEPGSLVGSPHYLAPEAVRDEDLDARADVYSLGIVCYECLTGRRPFEADTAVATAWQHTTDAVPVPSRSPGVADELDTIVATATATEPGARFDDANQFAEALIAAVPDARGAGAITTDRTGTLIIPAATAPTVVARSTSATPGDGAAADGDDSRHHEPDRDDAPQGAEQPLESPTSSQPGPRPAPQRRRSRRRSRRWRRGLRAASRLLLPLAVLAVLAAGAALAWATLIAPVIDVPRVIDRPRDEAMTVLREAGFEPEAGQSRHDATVAAGHVIDQQPTGTARRGSTVRLIISDGPPPVEGGVPDVGGENEAAAIDSLRSVGLEPVVERRHHETIAKGTVLATTPAANTDVTEGTEVTVVVSRGPRPISVPEVAGAPRATAVERLEDLGLKPVVTAEVFDAAVPEGIVRNQQPAPGETLSRGDTVELTVSKGPEGFAMPDVRGAQRESAVGELRGLGLTVEVIETDRGLAVWRETGTVADQEPAADTTVYPDETVKVFVWK